MRPCRGTQGAQSNYKKFGEEPPDHAIGRSRGGLTTKNHLVCDGKGRALAFILTRGQAADMSMLVATLDRLDALEQERRDLRAQKERAQKAYVLGIMGERESVAEVQRIDALLDALDKEYDSLLRLPISLTDFDPEQGVDWRSWTPGRRLAALKGFIKRIEVGPYPEGMRRTRRRRKNESEQDYVDEQWETLKAATRERIRIVWQWES